VFSCFTKEHFKGWNTFRTFYICVKSPKICNSFDKLWHLIAWFACHVYEIFLYQLQLPRLVSCPSLPFFSAYVSAILINGSAPNWKLKSLEHFVAYIGHKSMSHSWKFAIFHFIEVFQIVFPLLLIFLICRLPAIRGGECSKWIASEK